MLRQGVALALAGLAFGFVGALGASRLVRSQLYGVTPADPTNLAVVCLALVAVAALASYVPARRATRVDPMVALRAQ